MIDDDLRDLYQEVILDHGKNPRNFRHPEDASHEALGNNPLCGDRLTVYLRLDEERNILDAAFEGKGCAISIASASMMTDMVKGKSLAEVKELFERFHKMCTEDDDGGTADGFEDELEKLKVMSGVRQFPMRVKCATLAWHAMNAAAEGEDSATTE